MAKPLSMDLRERAISRVEAGAQRQGALWPWKTMTFLAALRHDRSDAPWVFDGPINAESFRLYVEEVLVAA